MKKNNIFPVFLVLSGILMSGSGFAQADSGVQTTRGDVDRSHRDIRENRADRATSSYVEGEVVVKLKGDSRFRRVRLAQGVDVEAAIESYRGRDDVVYAEPNYIATAHSVPNDPYYGLQWHFDNPVSGGIDTEQAWDISTGAGVVVAVIDTGVAYEDRGGGRNRYYQAPDLADTCFVQGYDFVNNDTHANDDNSHGTHVAGTVAGSTNNGVGVAGSAYETCIMPVKVLNQFGSGSYTDIANGIYFAANNGADIINLSLGGPSSSSTLEDAVEYAYNAGVTIFASAGNDNSSDMGFPANYNSYVIAVGATRFNEDRAYYSNYGASLDIVAPGGDVTVDQNGDGYVDGVLQNTFNPNSRNRSDFGYWFFQGTSMASPHAAGVAALVLANGNATTPDQVRAALQDTAKDLGSAGWDSMFGYGLINAEDALSWTAGAPAAPPPPPVDNPPTATATGPSEGTVVSGTSVSITADATDDIGVDRVDFYVGADMVGSDSTNAYGIVWDSTTVSDGDYVLKVTAVDSASQTTSDSVNVTVDNVVDPPPPPPPPPPSTAVLFEDSFESGFGNWTQGPQNDWKQSDQRATDGSYSAEVDGRAVEATLTSDSIDLQLYSNVTVSADMYIEGKLDSNEYIALETSTDGGVTWVERARLQGNVDDDDVWYNMSFPLWNITSLQIRLLGTMSRSNEDANVDMVIVEGIY